ncbi:hypothetical protein GX50_07409 [[Emmonsia] crescens]|uniref:Uncharacterized protein n=1 Tax=[Emmonsia] crescens TaxID=73230 RepID=A0A2B7Z8S2_9EURO|nr:hypothetical protein GX50_07409 [Emmonsia crescens]
MKKTEWTRPLRAGHAILRHSYQAKHVQTGALLCASYLTTSTNAKRPHVCLPVFTARQSPASIPPPPKFMSSSTTSSHTEPSHAENIRDTLHDFKHDKWGWVIYRCTYGDDEAWARFQQIVNERSRKRMAEPDVPPEVANSLEWTFVSDPATLNGASRDQLRTRFLAWAAEAEKTEQPRADGKPWAGLRLQRYAFFIQVDEESLRSVVEGNPEELMDGSWVHLVHADEDQDFGQNAKAEEDDEEEEDEGWIMIAADMIGPDFYDAIGPMPESWYAFYSPAPGFVLY